MFFIQCYVLYRRLKAQNLIKMTEEIKTLIQTTIEGKIKYFWVYVLLSGIIALIGVYSIQFFKNKGGNLATKQDIADITQKIESLKYDYQKKPRLDSHELALNKELYDALNEFQNCVRPAFNYKSEEEWDKFTPEFEQTENTINKLHISHASTYYAQYEKIGSKLEQCINDLLNAQRMNNFEETSKKFLELTVIIEEYKKAISKYIKQ